MWLKRNPKFGQNREFSWTRKILKTGSTNTDQLKHELYHKFDEDHEYVVVLGVEWIFTELLTEMSKPEVEKKAIIERVLRK